MVRSLLTTLFFIISVASVIWLIVGLISPQKAIRWGNESQKTRKRVVAYGIGTTIVSMIFAGIAAPPLTPEQKAAIEQKKVEKQQKEEAAKLEQQLAKEHEEAQKVESDKKAAEDKELQDKYDKQAQYEEWLKWKETQELQDKYDKQAQYEEWLQWKEANEHPYMKYLRADGHPKFNDSKKSIKKFYKDAGIDDYVVYSEGINSDKNTDDWLFWYGFSRQDSVSSLSCALSRINGGMTLEEALPIILTYLPDGEISKHSRSFYREPKDGKTDSDHLPFYCFQFSGQLFLTVWIEDGCVSKFSISHGTPYTGKGHFNTYTTQDINYDLTQFVK